MSDAVTVIIDDTSAFGRDSDFDHSGPWVSSTFFNCAGIFNSSRTSVNSDSSPGTFLWKFDGLSIAAFGLTPPATSNQDLTVKIATSDILINQTLTYPSHSTLGQFYSSPEFSSGIDALFRFDGQGLVIDYFLVKASNTTKLKGRTILVDDTNPEIRWNGNWTLKENYYLELAETSVYGTCLSDDGRIPKRVQPHGNGTHESRSQGDSFSFRFSGSSILVSGVNPASPDPGAFLLMDFVVDSTSKKRSFSNGSTNRSEFHQFVFFQDNSLEPGDHTLTVTLLNVTGNISAIIDFLAYNPIFDTILDKPNYALDSSGPQDKNESKGLIIGSAVAALMFLFIVLLGLWLFQKKRGGMQIPSIRRNIFRVSGDALNLTTEPFTLTTPTLHSGRKVLSFNPQHAGEIQRRVAHVVEQQAAQRGDESTFHPQSPQLENLDRFSQNMDMTILGTQMREIQSRMDVMLREMSDMSRYVVPPSYGRRSRSDSEVN